MKKIKDSKKSKYAATAEMQQKGKPIKESTDTVTVDGVDYRFRIEEFEDGNHRICWECLTIEEREAI